MTFPNHKETVSAAEIDLLESIQRKRLEAFYYNIVERLGTLHISRNKRFRKEVNILSVKGGDPKIDLRTWDYQDPNQPYMKRGIQLTEQEAQELRRILNKRFEENKGVLLGHEQEEF